MKRAKGELAQAEAAINAMEDTKSKGLKGDLKELMQGALSEQNARGIWFMSAYYGLSGKKALTLEGVGEKMADGLTRERVRQIIDGALERIKEHEQAAKKAKPYEKTAEIFNQMLRERSPISFVKMGSMLGNPYFAGFGDNQKGLVAFLSDAGIKQVVYRGKRYVYPGTMGRKDAIDAIQGENKKERRAKTIEKMASMAKTVTYVPSEIRGHLARHAEKADMPLNRLYEKLLERFMTLEPYQGAADFPKTKSWKARQGKAEWEQVGIYIERSVFDAVKEMAGKIKPGKVSNMAYICKAFMWFSDNPKETLGKGA